MVSCSMQTGACTVGCKMDGGTACAWVSEWDKEGACLGQSVRSQAGL